MRRTLLLACSFVLISISVPVLADGGVVEVVVRSAPYTLVDGTDGLRIEMDGFGQMMRPGGPMLPEREFLVLLPPGARVQSVEGSVFRSRALPGTYAVAPAPQILTLAAPGAGSAAWTRDAAEWREAYRAAYSSDRPYPGEAVRLAGSGSLRKYAYARVAFRPFSYRPESGRLIHHDGARVRVRYSLPEAGGAEALHVGGLLRDTVADEAASRLFVNFEAMRGEYDVASGGEATGEGDFESHDYVIITTPDNVAAVQASGFVAWKTSIGFDVRIVLTTDTEIAGQPGTDLAERIRNFLRANYGPWGIEYVLLVGDYAAVPMRLCYPDPENHLHDPADPGTTPGSVPTDAYYADLSLPDAEGWDLDGDGFYGEYEEDAPDFATEVHVGRIPTNDAYRITYTLDKIVRVEDDTSEWKRHALHAGAVLFYENQDGRDIPLRDGATVVAEIEGHLMQGWTMSRYSEQAGLVPSSYPWPALTFTAFLSDWMSGTYGFVNWAGHGWPDQVARTIWSWDDGDGVPETDGSDTLYSDPVIVDGIVLNDDYPSIVCAVSCDVGYPEPNPFGNLGIHLLTEPQMASASAVVSSSRYAAVSRDWPAIPGGAESLCYEFNRYAIAGPGGPRKLGAALGESKFYAHVNFGWDNDYEVRNLYNYNLYGDPAMDWRGAGVRTGNLLRGTDVTQLDPVAPPLGDCLPLDPVEDLHMGDFEAGSVDPDPAAGCPLVFYAVDGPVRIWLDKTPAGEVKIDF